jgi:hypothetical protein
MGAESIAGVLKSVPPYGYDVGMLVLIGILFVFNASIDDAVKPPYANSKLIFYDNDGVEDVYTDEYLMALATEGNIKLLGMSTSTSFSPFNKYVQGKDYEKMLADRALGVSKARKGGFVNLPEPVPGPRGHLQRPASGKIRDTKPIGSVATLQIVEAARKTTTDKPLVLIMGGPLTVAADAYVLDNSIRENVIVAWLGGTLEHMGDYNGWADPWAAYIVLQRLRLIVFPAAETGITAAPTVSRNRLLSLPENPLRAWMTTKQSSAVAPILVGRDADAPPAIALMRSDYLLEAKRVSFSHWVYEYTPPRYVPAFRDDPEGRTMVVTRASKTVATKEWWRAITSTQVGSPQ